MLIIPASLITYGVTSLQNPELKNMNLEVREELWDERPHRQIHIDNYLQFAPAAAVYGLNALGIKGEHNFRDRTIIYGLSTAIMASTVYTTKHLSRQWRPDESDKSSFPSGHTATAFAAAEFLRKEYWNVSPWYGIAGYAAAATTGYLRMYNNKHWLSDVVAGAGIGILSTDLAYWLYPSVKKLFVKEKGGATAIAPFYQQGAIGLSLVHHFK
ncbi:MAG: phosphatase PAP2 family protein [Niastella sp.]|nr:phosphatase PAP2 family protein [Niastella sp.]